MPVHVGRFATSAAAATLAATLLGVSPGAVWAHGAGADQLTTLSALTSWTLEPLALLGILAAAAVYLAAVRRVDRVHRLNPVPRRRTAAWLAGLLVVAVALFSFLDVYAGQLFSVHMVQHILLTMVAAPLLVLGAPVTLLLRALPRGWRTRRVMPFLESAPLRLLAHPVVGWTFFAGVMWAAHFSPLFDAALEDDGVHALEHALFLSAAVMFWWPVIGADPSPHRMGYGTRFGYVLLSMPQNSFLGLAIFSAPAVLFAHYATLTRAWGPTPLEDQQIAGGIMWAVGDMLFLVPLLFLTAAWLRSEEEKGRLHDEWLDRERPVRPPSTARSVPARPRR